MNSLLLKLISLTSMIRDRENTLINTNYIENLKQKQVKKIFQFFVVVECDMLVSLV